jgi:hypothetical protein
MSVLAHVRAPEQPQNPAGTVTVDGSVVVGQNADVLIDITGTLAAAALSAGTIFVTDPSGIGSAGPAGPTGAGGATGPVPWTAPAAWTNLTVGVVGPPATVVTRSGHTYACVAAAAAGVDPATDAGAHWLEIV